MQKVFSERVWNSFLVLLLFAIALLGFQIGKACALLIASVVRHWSIVLLFCMVGVILIYLTSRFRTNLRLILTPRELIHRKEGLISIVICFVAGFGLAFLGMAFSGFIGIFIRMFFGLLR